ncbi:hypothetical protein RB595_006781 [Gaeumannomyces hyphopodioides]
MIVRGLSRCGPWRPHAALRAPNSPLAGRAQYRRYSASSSTAATAGGPQASSAAMLAPFVEELDRLAPSFKIHGSRIRIIQTPTDFYDTLKDKIRHAERRIFLSTLYIGKSEKDLIATLRDALRAKPDLKLSILTDALRGTRESPDACSASLLAPLVSEFGPERVEIRMYHTPNLTGMRKKHIPRRINEGWGLQHMKLYGFDDEIILSGANLSTDYFTNRQDRYHMFSSSDITSYFWGLQKAVCSLSFLVRPSSESVSGFELDWPTSNEAPSPLENPKQFVANSTRLLRDLISAKPQSQIGGSGGAPNKSPANMTQAQGQVMLSSHGAGETPDTSVYVLAQMSQLLRPDISTEQPALTHVLSTLASSPAGLAMGSSWTFTAGYFNPAPSLTRLLLSTVPAGSRGTVITASPYANGFYRSRGVSGMLPDAYSLLARRFLDAVERQRRGVVEKGGNDGENVPTVTLKEWRRGTSGEPGGWTYHAKGLWVTLGGDGAAGPSLTVIGSSNYTKRSYSLDLEANALVVTTNEGLQRRLADEQAWLQEHAAPVCLDDFAKTERRVGLKVRIAMWIVKMVGGQL